ncbi:MAG: formate/nitrite transporter family protein [Butyricicoccus pullicaecorum]|nr:formate/nitrite transporter family protein [Butyricicoccus pullicaecorum]
MKKLELYISSVLAGMLIGIAGTLYIASGKSFFGAVLFTVALFTICTRGMGLFTGRVGYLWAQSNKLSYIAELGTIWVGNLTGCIVLGAIIRYAKPAYVEMAAQMSSTKLSQISGQTFLLAVLCGMLMFIAVDHFRTWQGDFGRFLGMLFCIPAFIVAGFEHVVADMFYFALGLSSEQLGQAALFLIICSLGNSVGAWLIPWGEKKA